MSLKVTDCGHSIMQPSTCLNNLLWNLKSTFCSKFYQQSSEIKFQTNYIYRWHLWQTETRRCFVWQIKQLSSKLSPNPLLSIKLTIELNPSKFLDTKLVNTDGAYKFNFYRKYPKLPPQRTSKTPKRYKQNTINGDLHCSKRILSNLDKEIHMKDYEGRLITHYVS